MKMYRHIERYAPMHLLVKLTFIYWEKCMFTKKKKFIIILIVFVLTILVGCFSLTACSESKNNTVEQSGTNEQNAMKHYEIALNMQNFDYFLEYEYTFAYNTANPNNKGSSYLIEGVLSFAYYQNVFVTFRITKVDTTTYKDFDIKLNAAGNGGFYTSDKIYTDTVAQLGGDSNLSVSIQNIRGTIIFDV